MYQDISNLYWSLMNDEVLMFPGSNLPISVSIYVWLFIFLCTRNFQCIHLSDSHLSNFLWSQITGSWLSISIYFHLVTRSIIYTCWANPVTCAHFVLCIINIIAIMFCTFSAGSLGLPQLKNKKAVISRAILVH